MTPTPPVVAPISKRLSKPIPAELIRANDVALWRRWALYPHLPEAEIAHRLCVFVACWSGTPHTAAARVDDGTVTFVMEALLAVTPEGERWLDAATAFDFIHANLERTGEVRMLGAWLKAALLGDAKRHREHIARLQEQRQRQVQDPYVPPFARMKMFHLHELEALEAERDRMRAREAEAREQALRPRSGRPA